MKDDYDSVLAQASILKNQYPLSQMAWLALAGIVVETSAPKGNVRAILEYAPYYVEVFKYYRIMAWRRPLQVACYEKLRCTGKVYHRRFLCL